ncbi:hypothetical protein SK128_009956 [Halocaridina rubra]|uniref:Uncharacterized protein n=1 Tax=Halocaridina rubra TaxID=373956 RepID=A0AAN8WEQ4_HALRR
MTQLHINVHVVSRDEHNSKWTEVESVISQIGRIVEMDVLHSGCYASDPYNSYNCSRRNSLDSYESSHSSSSEDSFPSFTEMTLRVNEDYCYGNGHAETTRYIPGFAAIQECDEKSVRSSFSY